MGAISFYVLSGKRGSNPRPSAWEADALPTELLPHLHDKGTYFFSKHTLILKNFLPSAAGWGRRRLGIKKCSPCGTALASDFIVGVTRLELATSRPPDAYSNQLSYTPSCFSKAMQSYENFFKLRYNRVMKILKNYLHPHGLCRINV